MDKVFFQTELDEPPLTHYIVVNKIIYVAVNNLTNHMTSK